MADSLDGLPRRLRRGNDLQQVQIARRVEEMGAEPVVPEIVAASFRERRARNPGRVGADDRSRAPRGVDLFEETSLYIQPLDNGLDNPVALPDAQQISVEAAGCDQFPCVGREGRVRLQPAGAFEALRRGVGRHIEQQGRHAGVGEMGGNLGSHGAGAKHRD